MNLVQDFNSVIMENFEPFQFMIIYYNGSFDGEMVANGSYVMGRNKLLLYSISPNITNELFTYNGDFNIRKAFIYIANKRKYVFTKKESDNINAIKSKWNESTSKYTDFNRTNKRKPHKQTILRKRA